MSHEIRTPLNAIIGITEMLLFDDKLDEYIHEALSRIYVSGDMLLGIINDLLDLSKIESEKLEVIEATYDIASLISDTAQLNVMRIGGKPIEFELSIDENIPAYFIGDELRIKQILNNILSNAFKYTDQGTVTLSVSAESNEDKDKDLYKLIFTISDTGLGMTKDEIEMLFEEYSRFHLEANRRAGGTGLGMSITNNLIRMMNGEIKVESKPGRGSKFTIFIPQYKKYDMMLGKETVTNLEKFCTLNSAMKKRAGFTREPMPYGSVLIVDDVETNIFVAKGLLMPYKLSIDSVNSGFDAIKKVEQGNVYDIIFMDHMMPEIDGVDATRIIREMGYEHSIVALTANAVIGQENIFLKNGFNEFISKPIDIDLLNSILNRLIRDKQPLEVIEAARQAEADLNEVNSDYDKKAVVDTQVYEFFLKDAEKSISILREIHSKKEITCKDDIRDFIIYVHGLKSALGNIGEKELSTTAAVLEEMVKSDDYKSLYLELTDFLLKLETLVDKLTSEINNKNVSERDTDPVFLNEQLDAIYAACQEYDERTIDLKLTELKTKTWSAATTKLIDDITINLLHSNFEEIENIIKR